ncbi:MAG: M1 family aminopeptidase, partial [archaeon]|nr:M1 family aminopeptidase [archaeon]
MHRHLFEGMNGMSCHFQVGGEDSRFLAPDAKPQYAEDRGFIPTHIDLSLSVDIKKQHVRGEVKTKVELFPHSKEMIFHAVEMTIHSVKVNGKKSPYDYDKEKITIPRGKLAGKGVVAIAFEYTHPPMGMHFIHPTKDRPDKPYQVWTHSEAQEARYWYPCQDLPETKCPITQRITVESPFQVVGNGNLISTKKENGWITYTWDFPHPNPSYLNAIMIGEFDVIREKWKHVDIAYYFRKGKEKEARNGFKNTPQCLAFFSEYTGFEYPHNKYAQVGVADFIYGGMEHTTCTTMTDNILQDDIIHAEFDARPQQLIAHELAHQWFGDLLTCKDWSHGWLNEGFATFFEMLWQEHRNKDEGRYAFYQDIQIYLQEDKDL